MEKLTFSIRLQCDFDVKYWKKGIIIIYPLIEVFNFLLSLTLLLFILVLCQEDGPHQLPNRRLNRHEELPGVSAEGEDRETLH